MEYYRSHRCQPAPTLRKVTPLTANLTLFVLSLTPLFDRPPIIQYSHGSTAWFVYGTLAISLFTYGRFCTLVINDITNYMGIACFTVRKKDAAGIWRDATKEKKV